jgi:nitrate/nitrite transport system ATP-binding protein
LSKPFLHVEHLTQRYPGGRRGQNELVVFDDLSFGVDQGELVTMIGHSGCGKSTVLGIIAGLNQASDGYVFVNGQLVKGPSITRGVIFQNHSLLPWKTALGNVAFSVRARWPVWSREKIRAHSLRYLAMVGLKDGAEHRRPAQLSGGMRQRVGIARAFAIEPEVLLMDEPFGALDALTRATVQDALLTMWQQSRLTVFLITHDIDEAIYLSDRVLLMTEGPRARLAESVAVPLPRPRDRAALLKDPRYYEVRAHLVDFLHGRRTQADQVTGAGDVAPLHPSKENANDEATDERGGAGSEEEQGPDVVQAGRSGGAGRGVARVLRSR